MSWSARFIAELSAPVISPEYLLESVEAGLGDRAVRYSSHYAPGAYDPVILDEGTSIRWGSLSLDSWSVSTSTATISLADVDLQHLRPGTVFRLRMGFAGWDPVEFEPVWVGTLQAAPRNEDGSFTLQLQGLEGSLFQRYAKISPANPNLFAGVGATTTVAATYLAGATDIEVADASAWDRPTGGVYGLRITTGSTTHYLTATSLVGNVFSGVVRALNTLSGATIGDVVEYVAMDEGRPIETALKILTSTGFGTNGEYDVYPAGWGLGIPVELVDVDDAYQSSILAGPDALGSPSWWLHIREEIPIAQQWLASWLGAGGFYLTQRHGKITIRGVQPYESNPFAAYVTDDDIVSISSDAFGGPPEGSSLTVYDHADLQGVSVSPTAPDELPAQVRALLGALGSRLPSVRLPDWRSYTESADPWSRPTQGDRELVLPVFGINADRDAWLESVYLRLGVYATRRPELFRVRLLGLHWGAVCIGEAVSLLTYLLDSRRGPEDGATKGGRHIVIAGGPDLFGTSTEFTLAFVPPEESG